MISHCRILPQLSQFVGSAGSVGNQHRWSLKEQLDLFTGMSRDAMKPDKRGVFVCLSASAPPPSSSYPIDVLIRLEFDRDAGTEQRTLVGNVRAGVE